MGVQRYALPSGAVRYRARVKSHGRYVATRVFERKGEAVAWEQDQRRRLRLGEWIDPRRGQVPLSVVAVDWLGSRGSATSWLLRRTDDFDPRQQQLLADLRGHCAQLDRLAEHVTSFAKMMAKRTGEQQLAGWLDRVDADDQPELQRGAARLLPRTRSGSERRRSGRARTRTRGCRARSTSGCRGIRRTARTGPGLR